MPSAKRGGCLAAKIVPLLAILPSDARPDGPAALLAEYHHLESDGPETTQWLAENNAYPRLGLKGFDRRERMEERIRTAWNQEGQWRFPVPVGPYADTIRATRADFRHEWQRTDLLGLLDGEQQWRTVLDIRESDDSLLAESRFRGWTCRPSAYDICLVKFAPFGSRNTVIREFDTRSTEFVEDGFSVAISRSDAAWLDQDRILLTEPVLVETSDAKPEVRQAVTVRARNKPDSDVHFIADETTRAIRAWPVVVNDTELILVDLVPATNRKQQLLLRTDKPEWRLNLPPDAELKAVVNGHAFVLLNRAAELGKKEFSAGSLIRAALDIDPPALRDPVAVLVPTNRQNIQSVTAHGGRIFVNLYETSGNQLLLLPEQSVRADAELIYSTAAGSLRVLSASSFRDQEASENIPLLFYTESFLKPRTVYAFSAPREAVKQIWRPASVPDLTGQCARVSQVTRDDAMLVDYHYVGPCNRPGQQPVSTIVSVYGGFQQTERAQFDAALATAWLDRGGAYVLAHVRGGGEFGSDWHRSGQREGKIEAIEDLRAVIEDLHRQKLATPGTTAVIGESNGGLLVAAFAVKYPDMVSAFVTLGALLDMSRYHKYGAGAGWIQEYGDPESDDWQFMRRYSPFDLLTQEAQAPDALIIAGSDDRRVPPFHSRKFVARLRETGSDVQYWEIEGSGHSYPESIESRSVLEAGIYSFIWSRTSVGRE